MPRRRPTPAGADLVAKGRAYVATHGGTLRAAMSAIARQEAAAEAQTGAPVSRAGRARPPVGRALAARARLRAEEAGCSLRQAMSELSLEDERRR